MEGTLGLPSGRLEALMDSHQGKQLSERRRVPLERASTKVELQSQTSSYVRLSYFEEQANPVEGTPPGGIPWGTRAV